MQAGPGPGSTFEDGDEEDLGTGSAAAGPLSAQLHARNTSNAASNTGNQLKLNFLIHAAGVGRGCVGVAAVRKAGTGSKQLAGVREMAAAAAAAGAGGSQAVTPAGCSQVIPSYAFNRKNAAPRLYWGSLFQVGLRMQEDVKHPVASRAVESPPMPHVNSFPLSI